MFNHRLNTKLGDHFSVETNQLLSNTTAYQGTNHPDVLTHVQPLVDVLSLAGGDHHLRDKLAEHRPLHGPTLRQQHGHLDLYAEVWLPLPHKQHLARFSVQAELLLNKSGLVRDHRLHHLWRVPAHHLQTLHDNTGQQLQHLIPLPLQQLLLL